MRSSTSPKVRTTVTKRSTRSIGDVIKTIKSALRSPSPRVPKVPTVRRTGGIRSPYARFLRNIFLRLGRKRRKSLPIIR